MKVRSDPPLPYRSTGFVRSWKTWRSPGIKNIISWPIHMFIDTVLFQRINIDIHVYSFNQTIMSHSFVSFKVIYSGTHRDLT